ncbi:MAG TPA: hypothetical protein VIB79_22300 [Candidatus Binatia bacterium]
MVPSVGERLDAASIPGGHDGWVVGNEPFVGLDFQGAATYAKQKS